MNSVILLSILSCLSSISVVSGENGAEKVRSLMLSQCQEKTGASIADVEAIKDKRIPETKQGLCMLDCILTVVKILNNGKYNRAGMMLIFTPAMKGDISRMNKLKQFTELCEREIGDYNEECSVGKKVVECLARHGKEYGISFHSNAKST